MLVTLYKRSKEETERFNETATTERYRALKHCPNCNSELYGEWEYYVNGIKDVYNQTPEKYFLKYGTIDGIFGGDFELDKKLKKKCKISDTIKLYRDEIKNFHKLKICPICKSSLTNEHSLFPMSFFEFDEFDYRISFDDVSVDGFGSLIEPEQHSKLETELILQIIRKKRIEGHGYYASELRRKAQRRLESFVESFDFSKENPFNSDRIKQDVSSLKQFMAFAFQIESDIFSVSERLKELYKRNAESIMDVDTSSKILICEKQSNIDKIEKECEELQKKLTGNYFDIQYPPQPKKPVFPSKPQEPIYQKPNIFNKKKVENENEQIKKRYEEECRIHEEKCQRLEAQYKEQKKQYDELVESLNRQKKQQLSELLEEKLALLEAAKEKLETLDREKNDIITPTQIKNKLIEDEILQAEELLRNLYAARHDIYECGVIFNKYCNFVAISSFHEYLSAGRCTSLEGADGAYNIYETEIRSNMIIDQLTEVIKSLQQIQKNQYLIYSAIQESNRQLSALNNSMNEAMSDIKTELSDMNGVAKEIAHNTKVSAHYSQVNAYYAKKNAELTNALGFMVALK